MNSFFFLVSFALLKVFTVSASSSCTPIDSFCHSQPAAIDLQTLRLGIPGLDAHLDTPPGQEESKATRKCTRELEGIVYAPPNAAKDYLLKIAREVAYDIATTSAPLASAATLRIMARVADIYRVNIELQPPFGTTNFLILPDNTYTSAPRKIGHLIAQTYLNQPGFQYNSKSRSYSLAIWVNGKNGIGFTVIISVTANHTFIESCNNRK